MIPAAQPMSAMRQTPSRRSGRGSNLHIPHAAKTSLKQPDLTHHTAKLQHLRKEVHRLSSVMAPHIDAARQGQPPPDGGHHPHLLKEFVAMIDTSHTDEQALQHLLARGFDIAPILEAGADFVEKLHRGSLQIAHRVSTTVPGSPRVNEEGRPGRVVKEETKTPSPEVPRYAALHEDPALIAKQLLEDFPCFDPLHPVTPETLREMLGEYERDHQMDGKAEEILKEFNASKSMLLFLKLQWTFGINRHVPFINLTTPSQRSIFYSNGHTGVVYTYEQNGEAVDPTEILLEGLNQHITCIATTKNGRWLAAGDTGPDYAAIVWDLQQNASPIKIFSTPCGKDAYGIASMCFAPSMRYLAMLSTGSRQVLAIYEWLVPSQSAMVPDEPLVFYELPNGETLQTHLSFNPSDQEMLMTCSKDRLILYHWHPTKSKSAVRVCMPDLGKIPGYHPIGDITRAVFVPHTTHIIIGTVKGLLVLFRQRVTHRKILPFEQYVEVVKAYAAVERGAVTSLACSETIVAVGDSNGTIRFYDSNLLILYTCEAIGLGQIDTISFPMIPIHKEVSTKFDNKPTFITDFLIGTSTNCVANITTTGNDQFTSRIIREEPANAVLSCAVHPNAARLTIGCSEGYLTCWDYKHKKVVVRRRIQRTGCSGVMYHDITALEHDPTGVYLACGFSTGEMRIVKSLDMVDEEGGSFCNSIGKVMFISFSYDGLFLATGDDTGVVCLYRNNTGEWSPAWRYSGCQRAHIGAVLALSFVREHGCDKERLFSLGVDSCLVEYDLDASHGVDLLILYREHTDPEAETFAFSYYPPAPNESFLVTSNNKYKLKLWNIATKMCRKTVNGPLFGSPIMGMTVLPARSDDQPPYVLWRNADSLGLMALPLDGNPYRYCSRRVHPLGVTCMKVTSNGCFVFTAGGLEAGVHMWSIHPEVLEASLEGKKTSLMPFFDLLEGGLDGKLYRDMEECFCYLQLKAQGMETRETRRVTDRLPLVELSNLFCYLSYYPSELEQKNIINEIKYSQFAATGSLVDEVDVGTVLKTFVNHRPLWGVQCPDVIKAFARFGFEELRTTVRPAQLLQILKGGGERMAEDDAIKALGILLNLRPPLGDWETVGAERDYYRPRAHMPRELTVQQIIDEVFVFTKQNCFIGPDNR
ncbi:cilia- and flagella-associated protein 251-like [Paramacrobiotus metropolitanus]|uniref:cilia- and flagella-associated protein 251-like n=1 Tax=Paramacrobiotus metropolitanus TaxID=2943436 RepID=UPI002445B1B6|nr:cilia- and flagella-associated protein 251-like [Paramacrobiotus metropolitanus]